MKQGQFPAILPLASLNGQTGFKISGEAIGDDCGWAVASLGDINGDSFDDLIMGARWYATGTGRSYLLFGGNEVGSGLFNLSGLNGNNGFKVNGESIQEHSGGSVSQAGDFNKDGYPDFLIGADSASPGGSNQSGRAYLVYGGVQNHQGLLNLSSLNGLNGFTLNGEQADSYAGYSVSAAGDVNKDGFSDLLISAWLSSVNGYTTAGCNYVIFGHSSDSNNVTDLSSLNGTNGFKLNGEASFAHSGVSVSGGGDVNQDGYADLIIGANGYGALRGRSYLIFGGSGVVSGGSMNLTSLQGVNGFKLDGELPKDQSGSAVALGDFNGDGYDDILIGAKNAPNGTLVGMSYVVFGGLGVGSGGLLNLSSLNGLNGFKLMGEIAGDLSGYAVSSAGDINGDGYHDLIIGAPGASPGSQNKTGRSYVVFGGPGVGGKGLIKLTDLNGVNGFKLDGENLNEQSGLSVSGAGDINGDGLSDLLIGAPHLPGYGGSYVVFGDAPPVLVNNSLSLPVGATIQLNSTYLAAYDRNHNNNSLVFIPSGVTHGQFETTSNPGIPLVNFTQQQVTSGAIQFVHDGTLVPPGYNITVRSTGIAWAGPIPAQINFIGAPQSYFPTIIPLASLNGQNGFKLDGENNNDQSGFSVSAGGDVNADGYADLLIGASNYPSAISRGRSYVVFGGPNVGSSGNILLASLNGANGFKMDGENNNDISGYPVHAPGDVNGDSYSDLLIGARGYLAGSGIGRSYVVFGGPGVGSNGTVTLGMLNGVNGFKLDGENNGDSSGSALGAGDINGDGYIDLMIGANAYPSGSGARGRSYVVFGGPGVGSSGDILLASLNGAGGFKLDGENNGDYSGARVSYAGDVNGDGYADLLIGAHNYPSGNNRGRSYVIFGSPKVGSSGDILLASLNGSNGFKLDGENNNDFSGCPVNTAGDINGDGYIDLLIGAYGYPNGSY